MDYITEYVNSETSDSQNDKKVKANQAMFDSF